MAVCQGRGKVAKIIPFSAVDGPGNRSVIFLQGCNYDCVFCHNPETIPVQSPEMSLLSPEQVFEAIGEAVHFIRGITVSGGECTLQPAFVQELFQIAKAKGLTTMIDSNGSYCFAGNPRLLAVTDGIMLDVKSMDDEEHQRITGRSNQKVLENLSFLSGIGKLFEIRTVCSPNLLDCEATVKAAAKAIAPYGQIRYKLIRYRPKGVRKEFLAQYKAPDTVFMKGLERIAKDAGVLDVVII